MLFIVILQFPVYKIRCSSCLRTLLGRLSIFLFMLVFSHPYRFSQVGTRIASQQLTNCLGIRPNGVQLILAGSCRIVSCIAIIPTLNRVRTK